MSNCLQGHFLPVCRVKKISFWHQCIRIRKRIYTGWTVELNPSIVALDGICCTEDWIAFPTPMYTDNDEEVWRFEGAGALASLWVLCLMDGHSSAFLPLWTPTHPPLPYTLSSRRWWTSSLLWRTDKRRSLSFHSALWTLTKNLLLPVSGFWLRNAVIGGSLPMFSVRPTLESSPRYCHGHIHRILACQWTKSIFISILPWCFCQQRWSLSSSLTLRKTCSITYCKQNNGCLSEAGLYFQ